MFYTFFSKPFSSFHPYHNQGSELIWKNAAPPGRSMIAALCLNGFSINTNCIRHSWFTGTLMRYYPCFVLSDYVNYVILLFVTVIVNCCWMLKIKDSWLHISKSTIKLRMYIRETSRRKLWWSVNLYFSKSLLVTGIYSEMLYGVAQWANDSSSTIRPTQETTINIQTTSHLSVWLYAAYEMGPKSMLDPQFFFFFFFWQFQQIRNNTTLWCYTLGWSESH